MQYIVNLAVFFLFCDFLGRNHINVISVIRLSQEGGVGIFSEKEGGYGMTLRVKIANLAVLVFILRIFILRGDTSPSDAPEGQGRGIFFLERKRGMA